MYFEMSTNESKRSLNKQSQDCLHRSPGGGFHGTDGGSHRYEMDEVYIEPLEEVNIDEL